MTPVFRAFIYNRAGARLTTILPSGQYVQLPFAEFRCRDILVHATIRDIAYSVHISHLPSRNCDFFRKNSNPPVYHPNFIHFLGPKATLMPSSPQEITQSFVQFPPVFPRSSFRSTLLLHPATRPWESLPHVHQLLAIPR